MGSEDRSTGVFSLLYRLHASHLRHNFQSLLDSSFQISNSAPAAEECDRHRR